MFPVVCGKANKYFSAKVQVFPAPPPPHTNYQEEGVPIKQVSTVISNPVIHCSDIVTILGFIGSVKSQEVAAVCFAVSGFDCQRCISREVSERLGFI
jgi:hypothetical protein